MPFKHWNHQITVVGQHFQLNNSHLETKWWCPQACTIQLIKEKLSKKNVLFYSVNVKGSFEDLDGSHYLESPSEWGAQFLEEYLNKSFSYKPSRPRANFLLW